MLPSNLNLKIGKKKAYNNKTLVSDTDMKIDSNRDINKDYKKLLLDAPKKIVNSAARHDLKMLTKKNNDENLAITFLVLATGLIAHHVW